MRGVSLRIPKWPAVRIPKTRSSRSAAPCSSSRAGRPGPQNSLVANTQPVSHESSHQLGRWRIEVGEHNKVVAAWKGAFDYGIEAT
jgi:hypothetical protein